MKKCKMCCRELQTLHKKSHIIPKTLFKSLKGENGNQKIMKILPNEKYKKSFSSDDFYEQNILCSNCEKHLSKYESYLSAFLKHKIEKPTSIENIKGNQILKIEQIDSYKIKTVLLSILWRSSITSHSFFEIVDLGIHSDKIKDLILNKDKIENKFDYPILITVSNNEDMNECVLPIEKIKHQGLTQYTFTIDKFRFIFFIGSLDFTIKAIPKEFVLDDTNVIKVLKYSKGYFRDLFSSYLLKDKSLRPRLG